MDEALFPHTYNPKMSLAVVSSHTPAHQSAVSRKGRKGKDCTDMVLEERTCNITMEMEEAPHPVSISTNY